MHYTYKYITHLNKIEDKILPTVLSRFLFSHVNGVLISKNNILYNWSDSWHPLNAGAYIVVLILVLLFLLSLLTLLLSLLLFCSYYRCYHHYIYILWTYMSPN